MIRETIITTIIASMVGGGALTAGKFWADNVYVRQETYRQSVNDQRIWQLQDRINEMKRRAAREGRPLNQFELNDIDEMTQQINSLK